MRHGCGCPRPESMPRAGDGTLTTHMDVMGLWWSWKAIRCTPSMVNSNSSDREVSRSTWEPWACMRCGFIVSGRMKLASCCAWENKNTQVALQAGVCVSPDGAVRRELRGSAVRKALLLLQSQSQSSSSKTLGCCHPHRRGPWAWNLHLKPWTTQGLTCGKHPTTQDMKSHSKASGILCFHLPERGEKMP